MKFSFYYETLCRKFMKVGKYTHRKTTNSKQRFDRKNYLLPAKVYFPVTK